jgi:hypothetical protein
MSAQTYIITNDRSKSQAIEAVKRLRTDVRWKVVIEPWEPTRSGSQNDKMWAMLTDISRQVVWYGQKLSPEDWKHVFSASIQKQRAVPGLDGGFVVLGVSTRRKSKAWFSELFELMYAFGVEHDVEWSGENVNS